MKITSTAQRILKPIIRLTSPRVSNLNIRPLNYQPYQLQGKRNILFQTSFNFSNQKKPQKEPKKNDFKQNLQQFFKRLNDNFDKIYTKKVSVSSIIAGVCLCALGWLILSDNKYQQVSMIQFINLLESNRFKQVVFVEQEYFYTNQLKQKKIEGIMNNEVIYCYVQNFSEIYNLVIKKNEVSYRNERRHGFEVFMHNLYIYADTVSLIVIFGILFINSKKQMMGRMNIMSNKKKFQITKNVTIKFNDVAGLAQVKRQVEEIVDFLKRPQKYTNLGATIPKGVLLTGPPGTGKTLLAKACAGQAGVPFYSVSGSDFVEMYVGVGASRVRQLFSEAKSTNNSAIIFIDELDAIGKKRQNKLGGNDERESTLNQLLVQMDGFGTSNKIVVMAATNRKQILDSALVRPGRFDRQVEVTLPDLKGRWQIFKVHLKPLKLSHKYSIDDYAKRLASLTPGFSGAQIANLCNQAAILSARHGKDVVEMIDFQISSERVIGGVQRKGFVSLQQKKTVSYHQCGHAVVSWFLEGADPLLKVTIIPRSKGALGFAQYFLNQNALKTRQQILDRICFILGGRCAEQYFFDEITTGAYDDLSKAYDLAYSLVAKYGMDGQIGYISFPDVEYKKPYGQETEAKIDRQIKKIILDCTQRTKKIVAQKQDLIKRLAEQLLIKQTLDVRSIQKILGKRPFPPNKTFQAYLETSQT